MLRKPSSWVRTFLFGRLLPILAMLLLLGCSSGSDSAEPLAPSITTQPASTTVVLGAPASFSVMASGGGALSYQWQKDGAALGGQTSSTLRIPAASAQDAGSYAVTVTAVNRGREASTTSQPAQLHVNVPPVITLQPASAFADLYGTAVFAVEAAGNGTLGYQWQKDGVDLPGQTHAVLILHEVGVAQAGAYRVVVSNTLNGTVTRTTSQPAELVMLGVDDPVVVQQPANLIEPRGDTATFSVVAVGSGSIEVQWMKDGVPLDKWGPTLSIPSVTDADAGAYKARITNRLPWGTRTIVSMTAILTVHPGTGSFTMAPPIPAVLDLWKGSAGHLVVTIARTDSDLPLQFSLQGAPEGVTGSTEVPGHLDIAVVPIRVAATVLPGVYPLSIRATDGLTTRSQPLTLIVLGPSQPAAEATATGSFSIFDAPPTLVIPAGAPTGIRNRPALKLVLLRDRQTKSIDVSLLDPPAGISGSASFPFVSTRADYDIGLLPINVAASVVPKTYALTVQATDHTTTVTRGFVLTVQSQGEVPPMSGYMFRYQNYNLDGTLKDCPVEPAGETTFRGVNYLLHKLPSNRDSIKFNDKKYTVYSFVPEHMTIDHAYHNDPQNYFDQANMKAFGLKADIPQDTINGGKNSTLTLASGVLSGGWVYQAVNDQDTTGKSAFFIPNRPNTKDGEKNEWHHDGLTENVIWLADTCLNRTQDFAHMIQYGWSLKSPIAKDPVVWRNLKANGTDQWPYPEFWGYILKPGTSITNHFTQTVKGDYPVDDIDTKIHEVSTVATYKDPDGKTCPTDTYPFPSPVPWLKKGAFMQYLPAPGFRMNLLRAYTPAGSYTPLGNTSGLFIRGQKDVGSVEFPAVLDSTGKAVQPFPIVVQTWDDSQRFTVLNKFPEDSDDLVAAVITDYPGLEWYNLANVFLPGKAGVVTSQEHYTVDDNITPQNDRQSDMWLGFRGETVESVSQWDEGPGHLDLGGQANKPYMLGGSVSFNVAGKIFYSFRAEHSNSFIIIPRTANELDDKLYTITFFADLGDGKYLKMGSLSWEYKLWKVTTDVAGMEPKWAQAAATDKGLMVPKIDVNTAFPWKATAPNYRYEGDNGTVITFIQDMAKKWKNNSISWGLDGTGYANTLGGRVTRYKISAEMGKPELKILVVISDGKTPL